MWNLSHLIKKRPMTGVAYHSGAVRPGFCFVAIRGLKTDGHQFVEAAIAKGASVVVLEKDLPLPKSVTKILVEDSRDALARIAADFYGDPTRELHLVGITGTNGKTTTAFLLEKIWERAGYKPGLFSTIATRWGDVTHPSLRTTPESSDLQQTFRAMRDEGVSHCVMEVTSHGLELKRVVGCQFDGAIFTNLSQDHLDFHENMENYFASKAKLFRERLIVSEKKNLWAVINWDDEYGRTLVNGLPAKVWRFSKQDQKAEIFLRSLQSSWDGLQMELETPAGTMAINSPLLGEFHAENIMAATAGALAGGIAPKIIEQGIADLKGVPGRLEKVGSQKFTCVVDFAHTPAALENVLQTLQKLTRYRSAVPGKIIVVFGCGGNRDAGKRPKMGAIADRLADVVILTNDNPRFENPESILAEIKTGVTRTSDLYLIPDRREAIAKGLSLAQPGDCVLVAGKGHETTQEIGDQKIPFVDREVINAL